MLVLGLMGSPRKNGNTAYLLSSFMAEAERMGGRAVTIDVPKLKVTACIGCGTCERKGFCPFVDDMKTQVYQLLRAADVVVLASPVYFYGVTAQMKLLIDRSQALWSRKYKLGLTDPGRKSRKGILLSVGATRGKQLFDGVRLTAQYFFDAVGATSAGELTYRRIEELGDMKGHESVLADVRTEAEKTMGTLCRRKRILFAGKENAVRSQMAAAFARYHAGDRVAAECFGSAPAEKIEPLVLEVMAEKGIDMAHLVPKPADAEFSEASRIIQVGAGGSGGEAADGEPWALPSAEGMDAAGIRILRDEIEEKVLALIGGLNP